MFKEPLPELHPSFVLDPDLLALLERDALDDLERDFETEPDDFEDGGDGYHFRFFLLARNRTPVRARQAGAPIKRTAA